MGASKKDKSQPSMTTNTNAAGRPPLRSGMQQSQVCTFVELAQFFL